MLEGLLLRKNDVKYHCDSVLLKEYDTSCNSKFRMCVRIFILYFAKRFIMWKKGEFFLK